MADLVLIDTSILLNILNVPGLNADYAETIRVLDGRVRSNDTLYLPYAAIYETGNHIAQCANAVGRRKAAARFVKFMQASLEGTAPWHPLEFPDIEDVHGWIADFVESATRKVGMGDLSMSIDFHRLCELFPRRTVTVWSLDEHLAALHRKI